MRSAAVPNRSRPNRSGHRSEPKSPAAKQSGSNRDSARDDRASHSGAVITGAPSWRRPSILMGGTVLVGLLLAAAYFLWSYNSALAGPATIGYEILRQYPHDPSAFCQGLVYENGVLFESTGKYRQSTLRRVELETGNVLQRHALHDRLFGEGITIWGDQIVQLTWKSEIAIIYNKQAFEELGRFRYAGQGWGLTNDGTHWIMSDGSSTLKYIDPRTKRVVRHLPVHIGRRRIGDLNELEYIRGEIYANVFQKNYIVRISPRNGEVTGVLDLSQLHSRRRGHENVLNGIAYDAEKDRLFVTGKNWESLYELRLLP